MTGLCWQCNAYSGISISYSIAWALFKCIQPCRIQVLAVEHWVDRFCLQICNASVAGTTAISGCIHVFIPASTAHPAVAPAAMLPKATRHVGTPVLCEISVGVLTSRSSAVASTN